MRKLIILLFLLLAVGDAWLSGAENKQPLNTIKNVVAEGSCAVVGMRAEQSQLIALQRARATAIEQAAGVAVSSSTVVTNFRLAADFIKTYSKGFIVKEKIEWFPLGQYQKDPSTAPIPEYRVKIVADVCIPETKIRPIRLEAKLNNVVFRSGEKAKIEIKTGRKARIAIFNITADDKAVMLFPNQYEKENIITEEQPLIFPSKGSRINLKVTTMPGHERDTEALFVVAIDESCQRDLTNVFKAFEPLSLSAFFRKYAELADYSEDVILAYEVVNAE